MKTPITTNIKVKVSLNRIKDLLCSAFEGGSNYWIKSVDVPEKSQWHPLAKYFHENALHGQLTVHTWGDEGKKDNKGKGYLIDFDICIRGLEIMAEKFPAHFGDFLAENDDAITGDVYLQCCLFGNTVYG